jgi:hypothetical protein
MNISKIIIYISLLFIIFPQYTTAQSSKDKKKRLLGTNTYFGLRLSYTIAGNFIQKNDITKQTDSSFYKVTHTSGYLFGAEIRHNFTKFTGIQTGVNFIRRNYDAFATISYTENPHDTVFVHKTDTNTSGLQFIAYEIPVKAIYLLPLLIK